MSVKLTLVLSGRTVERFEFEDEVERLRVGRAEECEIRIDNLGVSRLHCEIVREGPFRVLRDLQSNNGTFVNGSKVEVHNLNTGDVITLGKYSLEYQSAAPSKPEVMAKDLDLPMDGAMTLQVNPTALARLATSRTKLRAHVVIEPNNGQKAPRTLVLDKAVHVIGKDGEADLRVEGWFCPRVVALLVREDAGFRLIDVTERGESVRVNGGRHRNVRLNDGDDLRVRELSMKFNLGAPVGVER
jgi:hypothetical protein